MNTPDDHEHFINTDVANPWIEGGKVLVIPCGWEGAEGTEFEDFTCRFEAVVPLPADLVWKRAEP